MTTATNTTPNVPLPVGDDRGIYDEYLPLPKPVLLAGGSLACPRGGVRRSASGRGGVRALPAADADRPGRNGQGYRGGGRHRFRTALAAGQHTRCGPGGSVFRRCRPIHVLPALPVLRTRNAYHTANVCVMFSSSPPRGPEHGAYPDCGGAAGTCAPADAVRPVVPTTAAPPTVAPPQTPSHRRPRGAKIATWCHRRRGWTRRRRRSRPPRPHRRHGSTPPPRRYRRRRCDFGQQVQNVVNAHSGNVDVVKAGNQSLVRPRHWDYIEYDDYGRPTCTTRSARR